jgi:death-on-curing protein
MGEDAYADLWEKAAALFQSLVKGHALVDGNKRLGWLATAVFLELNAVSVTEIPNDEVHRFVLEVAAGDLDIDELAVELKRLVS